MRRPFQASHSIHLGDFNSQPDRYIPKEQLTSMRSGKNELPDDFGQPVYMVYPNGLTQGANGNRKRLLDYVFVSGNINVSGLRNIRVTDKENKPVSDHNMVSITVGLE